MKQTFASLLNGWFFCIKVQIVAADLDLYLTVLWQVDSRKMLGNIYALSFLSYDWLIYAELEHFNRGLSEE